MNTDRKFLVPGRRPVPGRSASALQGFTLVELLAVIGTLAVLAMLLLPTLASTKQNNQAAQCLENHSRLMAALRMYAEDNSGILAPNDYPYTTSYVTLSLADKPKYKCWATGTMEQGIDAKGGGNLLNPSYSILTDPVGTALANYIRDKGLYHCPADQYIDPYAGRSLHCRSYSMNAAVGTKWYGAVCGVGAAPCGTPMDGGWLPGSAYSASQTSWMVYGKLSSFTRPGPGNTFVLIDESPVTINDSSFAVSAVATTGVTYLIDYPSGRHNGASVISFADGHAVTHKWLDPRTYTPNVSLHGMGSTTSGRQTPDDPDCFYLAPITSARR